MFGASASKTAALSVRRARWRRAGARRRKVLLAGGRRCLYSRRSRRLCARFGVLRTPPSFLLDIVQCVVSFRSLWQLFHCRRGGGSPSLSLPHLISSLVSFDPPPTALDTASIALIIIGLCSQFLLPRPLLLRSCFMCLLPSFCSFVSAISSHLDICAPPRF